MLGCKEQIVLVSCVVRSKEVWVSLAISTEDSEKHAAYKMERHRSLQLQLF